MNNRERVIAALEFAQPDYTPYSISFTQQMRDKMIAYTGDPHFDQKINSHISQVNLMKPQVSVRPEYDRDEYGVVWNKSGADKDIGVVDAYLLAEQFPELSLSEHGGTGDGVIGALAGVGLRLSGSDGRIKGKIDHASVL